MQGVAPRYLELLRGKVDAKDPKIPFYSSVICQLVSSGDVLGPEYWVENLTRPVRFSSAVSEILRETPVRKTFVEIGPHSALAGPIRQILSSAQSRDEYVNVLTRGQDSHADLLKALGNLWLDNYPLDLSAIIGKGTFLHNLPLYPWYYEEPLWYESRLAKEWRLRDFPHHDVLGSRILETTDHSPGWRNLLRLDVVSWIKEHEIAGDIVFPGVGYITMVGEAIRQLSGAEDFTARRVHIKAALILTQGGDTEVITQLQKVPLTDSADSEWYSFSISSYQNGGWLKHAFGQVSAGSEFSHEAPKIEAQPRLLSRKIWYRKMQSLGLEYGARFMGLKGMSSHPLQGKFVATITNDIREGESKYAVHPVTLDCIPQSLAPAITNGLTRRFGNVAIPTYIEEIYIRPPLEADIRMEVNAEQARHNAHIGDIVAVSGGQVTVAVKGLQMSVISDGGDGEEENPHAAVELEWKEDVNLLDVTSLIKQDRDRFEVHKILDTFSSACMFETAERLRAVQPTSSHLSLYYTWLCELAAEITSGSYAGLQNEDDLPNLSPSLRKETIETLYCQLKETDAHAAATAIYRITNSCEAIFSGETNELELLLQDDVLHRLYDFMQNSEYAAFLGLAAHRKPNLKVLEIGAGTGGTTATVLPALQSAYGERMYLSYTYTDISSGFFPAAKERFKDHEAIGYAILDISKDPLEQGFERENFDLIIACNVGLVHILN
jgi:acyl transferase domain-containing protein